MQKVKITEAMMNWAQDKANDHRKGKRFVKSIDLHNSVLVGYIGDAVFQEQYPDAIHVDESNYDFVYVNIEIDVKSWWSKYPPRNDYYVQIPTVDIIRSPEVYVFACIMDGFEYGYLVGHIDAKEFKKASTYRKKGEKGERAGKEIKYTTNCWELPVSQLEPLDSEQISQVLTVSF